MFIVLVSYFMSFIWLVVVFKVTVVSSTFCCLVCCLLTQFVYMDCRFLIIHDTHVVCSLLSSLLLILTVFSLYCRIFPLCCFWKLCCFIFIYFVYTLIYLQCTLHARQCSFFSFFLITYYSSLRAVNFSSQMVYPNKGLESSCSII